MTPTLAPVLDSFHPNDEVRLLKEPGNIRSGALGRILGRYARSTEATYVVSFQNEPGCIEVRPDQIALA
jgi:hypothetical protein